MRHRPNRDSIKEGIKRALAGMDDHENSRQVASAAPRGGSPASESQARSSQGLPSSSTSRIATSDKATPLSLAADAMGITTDDPVERAHRMLGQEKRQRRGA